MSLYDALGVGRDASQDDIKRAHRRKARDHHPDKPGGDKSKFQEIQLAYDTLGDEERRRRYDETGSASGPEAPDPIMAKLAMIIDGLIDQLLMDGMPIETSDMRAHAIDALKTKIREIKAQKGQLERALGQARKLAKRFKRKRKAKAPDLILTTLARKERDISDAIAKVAEAIEIWGKAQEIFESYSYKFEAPPPSRVRPFGAGTSAQEPFFTEFIRMHIPNP